MTVTLTWLGHNPIARLRPHPEKSHHKKGVNSIARLGVITQNMMSMAGVYNNSARSYILALIT